MHERQKILLIIYLFIAAGKKAENLRADAMPQRHATYSAEKPTPESLTNIAIAQQIVTITDGQRTIAWTRVGRAG